jgi:predicted Zn-dependent protease
MELQFGAVIFTTIVFGGGSSAYILSQIGRQLIDAKFSRDKEYEADHFGVIYARKAGFDPTPSIAFFDRLRRQEKTQPGLAKAFESHPDTDKRIGALCAELTGMGYHITCPVAPAPEPVSVGTPPPAAAPAAPPAAPSTGHQ